jgi:hypothetical protein
MQLDLKMKLLDELNIRVGNGELFGIIEQLPSNVYHDINCPGISASKLSMIHKSFAYYKYHIENPIETTAMQFGSALHDAILLPQEFENNYIMLPDCGDGRTKEGKEKRAKFIEMAIDKKIISANDWNKLGIMIQKIAMNEACNHMLKDGKPELSMFWNDLDTGILCKGRMDYYRNDGIILDIKTSNNSNKKSFSKSIYEFGYERQAAFYLDAMTIITGKEHSSFGFIVIEKEPPYEIGLYVLGKKSIDTGRLLYKKDLQKYKDFLKLQPNEIEAKEFEIIDMPEWAHNLESR